MHFEIANWLVRFSDHILVGSRSCFWLAYGKIWHVQFLSLVYSKSYLFLEVTKVIWIFLFCFNHQYKIYSHASSWADEYAEKPSEQLLSISPEAFQTLAWNTWLETKTFVTMKEMFKCVFHVEAWHIISVYVRKIFK